VSVVVVKETFMGTAEVERQQAVERYRRGESAQQVCAAMGRSVRWLYKWIERAESDGEWWVEQSRRPRRTANRTEPDLEQAIVQIRHRLAGEDGFNGAQSIAWELEQTTSKVPSMATINRILKRQNLIDSTSRYRPGKGKRYPTPSAEHTGSVHQSDFVGPRYLRGPVRFYSLNTVDLATARCATVPLLARSSEAVVPALWETWVRLGIPKVQQLDNELVFFGSRRHPRGLSQLLRLCLLHEVEMLFIPPAEPWRNGVVEKFNDHWQQKFLRHPMSSFEQLEVGSRSFDARHNSRWRYRKINGKTPNEALAASRIAPRLPPTLDPPSLPLPRPRCGRYHFIRFIRSNRLLDIFGETFLLPAEAEYEYVQATVDIGSERLKVRLDDRELVTFDYAFPA
jgi:transposase